jgi:hypothetical protein
MLFRKCTVSKRVIGEKFAPYVFFLKIKIAKTKGGENYSIGYLLIFDDEAI